MFKVSSEDDILILKQIPVLHQVLKRHVKKTGGAI